jgi:hypothetical protein
MFVKRDDKVQLECSCENCLPVRSKWTYANKRQKYKIDTFKDDDVDTFKTVLTIEKLTEKDEQLYKCELVNDKGKRVKETQVIAHIAPQNIKITAKGKHFKNLDRVLEIRDLEGYVLTCAAQGYPIPKINWFKDGLHVGVNQIVLDKNKAKDHAGKYRCVVENSLGSISKDLEIVVKIPPAVTNQKDELIFAVENEKVEMQCEISGVPKPTISWTFNNKPIQISTKFKLSSDGKKLEFVGKHDSFGSYSCVGENSHGKATMTFTVYVKGKLDVPMV